MEFRILGPLEVLSDGQALDLGGQKQRALLALLLLEANRPVSRDRLIAALWEEEPTATAQKAIQVYVSQLRKALGRDAIATRGRGYVAAVAEGALDLRVFERRASAGARALDEGRFGVAAMEFRGGLELWRGPALADFVDEPFAAPEIGRLEELRLTAIEDRVEADLALGRHADLVGELEALVAQNRLRERLRAHLMLALYRSGRQADALELYRRTRETLSDELGIEPSLELQELERRMLQHDPALERARAPAREAGDGEPVSLARRPQFLVLAALVLAAVAAVIAAVALTGGGSSGTSGSGSGELRSFVDKLENFLGQSHDGRLAVAAAVAGAFDCKLTPQTALARLDRVQRNRQSLLQQAAALSVPNTQEAFNASDLLQKSVHASFTADGHYSDWLAGRRRCGPPDSSADLKAARAADLTATRTKRMFVTAFNPLASRLHERVWSADEF